MQRTGLPVFLEPDHPLGKLIGFDRIIEEVIPAGKAALLVGNGMNVMMASAAIGASIMSIDFAKVFFFLFCYCVPA